MANLTQRYLFDDSWKIESKYIFVNKTWKEIDKDNYKVPMFAI